MIVLAVAAIVVSVDSCQHAIGSGAVEAGLGFGEFPLENEAVGVDWGVDYADIS